MEVDLAPGWPDPVPPTPDDDVVAHVARLRTTPIKGFRVQEPSSVLLTTEGIAGDRAFFLMDRNDKLMSATRTASFLRYWASYDHTTEVLAVGRGAETLLREPVAAGGTARAHFFGDRYADGQLVDGPWNELLSDIAGQPVRLVRAAGPLGGYDLHPVSLLSAASVHALTPDGPGAHLDDRRFRMTVTVAGVAAFTEDTWVGEPLHVGEAVVRVTSPVRRCAAVQKDPDGEPSRDNALRRIQQVRGTAVSEFGRGLHLGVYADVEQPGLVRVGDSVRRGSSRGPFRASPDVPDPLLDAEWE